MADHLANATIEIEASPEEVWAALTDPEQIEKYMFGSQVVTDWKPGSPIVWKGEYEGKKYEDKGEIVEVEQAQRLKLSTSVRSAARTTDARTTTQSFTNSGVIPNP